MPHVVIEGEVDLADYAKHFTPIDVREARDLLRTEHVYLERSSRSLLIQALAIEAGRTQKFYVKISSHDRGTVSVRVDPLTNPERSDGVKRIVAGIGAGLLAHTPGARIRTTNLVLPSSSSAPGGGGPRRGESR